MHRDDQMMRKPQRWDAPRLLGRKERGQALVEFLLVFGILTLLVFGLVNIGQLLLANATINQAARAAAHQAAIEGGDGGAATTAAMNTIAGGVVTRPEDATITVICMDAEDLTTIADPCRRYDAMTVSIVSTSDFLIPLPPLFDHFTVTAAATRAAERDQQR